MDPDTDSGGRVTRSLRKRISSVDGDNSSRPGTPVPSKLTAITEINSPSRPTRMTRRNSTTGLATPVKRGGTPSIIAESTEAVTPARRSTRKRSISTNEGEETPQPIKAAVFEAVAEEITATVKPTTTRLTRLQSRSPEEIQTITPAKQTNAKSPESVNSGDKNTKTKPLKRRKPGPKSKTRLSLDEIEDLSDVEVINVEKEETTETQSNVNANIVDLIDGNDDTRAAKSQMEKEKKNSPQSSTLSKDELKTSNFQITSVTNVNDKMILIETTNLDNTKLSNKELPTENDEPTENPLSPNKMLNLNGQKTNKTSQADENITIIDLMDCDDESQELSSTKLPEKEKVTSISNDSPKSIFSESHLDNDKNEDVNPEESGKVFGIDDADEESMPMKQSLDTHEEMPKEIEPEEIPTKDSSMVINETLNNSKSERNVINIKEIDLNESKIKKSPRKSLQEKVNLEEIKFDGQNEIPVDSNSKDPLKDTSMELEKPADQQKDVPSPQLTQRKSTAVITEVININSTFTSPKQDTSSKNIEIKRSPRLSAKKLSNLNASKPDEQNITIIDLMDCDDDPLQLPEENKITTISNDSPKSKLTETHSENDTITDATAQNENIFDVDDVNETNLDEVSTIVIDETMLNKTISEETDTNESKPADSSENTTQPRKENLTEFDVENESMVLNTSDLNVSKGSEDIPIQTEIELSCKPNPLALEDIRIQTEAESSCKPHPLASVTSPRKSTATIVEVININSALTTTTPVIPSKKVEFNSSPIRDNSLKNVYPKTPAMIKSRRFIEMDSPRVENNPTTEGPEVEISEKEVDEYEVEKDQEDQKIKIDEQNTPPQESETNTHDLHELPEQKEKTKQMEELDGVTVISNGEKSNADGSENIEKVSSSPKEIENQLKWINPCVKGFTNEGCKLDAVVEPVKTPEKCLVAIDKNEITLTPKKAIIFSSDSNDEEEKHVDDEEENELAPGEKPYKRHAFHDDEALEMEDYHSGDSMDSEERREIIENEIPIDGESIGSATTDDENDEYVEAEDSENDSFIVSDNEVEENESTDSDDEGETIDKIDDRKKKKNYKRIQHPTESSSSSDDIEKEEEIEMEMKLKMNSSLQKSDKNEFDTSKLSDTALRLQCTNESESEVEVEENVADISRKDILRKLNQSDRFNKSVRDLNPESETSPIEHNDELPTKVVRAKFSESENDSEEIEEKNENDEVEGEEEEEEENQDEEKSSADEDSSSDENIKENSRKHKREKGSESQLGEVSVTTESDGDKENNNKNRSLSNRMPGGGGLSVSFGNFKKANKHATERKDWQRSFTIGVSVKGSDLDTAVTENKTAIENSSSSSPTFSNDEQDEELSSDDVHNLEKIRHMPLPLGNPLVRTRRQSLALPSNPDKDICSSPYCGAAGTSKKTKRKSLGILSTNEFNPSQSFIETIEMRKHEFVRNSAKRKRLSKSFCGAAETLDNSVIDIDVAHLHKRSKLAMDNSMLENYHDSIENINSCKLSSKAAISSTPCEKLAKKDSNNNVQRILSRCDEILEAANRAKLEDKINNKKSKVKLPKKNRKKQPPQRSTQEEHQEDESKMLAKQKIHNDKIRAAALAQALKAADDVIQGKKIQQHQRTSNLDEEHDEDSKRISSDILEEMSENVKKNNPRDIPANKMRDAHVTTVTTSGNFVEMPQTPEKKKKKKRAEIIQLPTGKMCVEPITPKQRSVLACNGTEFHESPVTPFAVGFKVRQMSSNDHVRKQASTLKDRKRKRNFDEQPMYSLPKPQWTQSGLFIEEEISTMRRIASSEASQLTGSRKLKKLAKANDEQNAYCNFKHNALMRGDIKRCTTREVLQLKERRQMQNQF